MRNSWFARQLIPPVIWHCYSYIRSYARYFLNAKLMHRNDFVKDSKKGQTVYILGNGPSLNNFNLEEICGKDVITMNYFYLHPEINNFNIVAHCIGEPFDCSTWVDPSDMVEKTPAETYWFSITAKDFCERNFKNSKLHYYLPGVAVNFNILLDSNLARPTLQYQSTSQMAIMVAMHLGYKKIYLLGFDHDWLATRGFSPHFYNENETNSEIEKADFSKISYLNMINISKNLFDIYDSIKNIASRKNISIVNLSRPTFLDIFPYKD